MNKLMIIALVLGTSTSAFADGFVCQAKNGSLTIKAYNNTQASAGTRNAAVLVLSDPQASAGEKTIARFTDVKGTLTSNGASYDANVDLRFKDQQNKEALVAGKAQLQELDTIKLDVAFQYNDPINAGDIVEGIATLNTRAGDAIAIDMSCERYLKN